MWSGSFIFISNNLTTCLPWRIAQSPNPEIMAKRLKPLQQKSVMEAFQKNQQLGKEREYKKHQCRAIAYQHSIAEFFYFYCKTNVEKSIAKNRKRLPGNDTG